MPFAKLTITTEDGTQIAALYNPEKYSVTKGVQYAEIGIPGLDEPVLQFIRGQNEKVTLDLFFDTTEQGMVDNVTDVRTLTTDVYNLLKVDTDDPRSAAVHYRMGKRQVPIRARGDSLRCACSRA